MVQKQVLADEKYIRSIGVRGHENCYKCQIRFKAGDLLYAILRNRGRSKYYHNECFEATLHEE